MARDYFKERRRELRRVRWAGRMEKIMCWAVLAEAFLIPLVPLAAMAVLLVGCAVLFLRLRIDRDFRLRRLPYDAPALLFVLIGLVSVVVAPDISFSFYNFYHLVPIYALTYLLAGQTLRTPDALRHAVLVMACAAGIVILYGFYQFVFGIDISAMKWVDGDAFPELSKRVFSTWENPNILAGYGALRDQRILAGLVLVGAAVLLFDPVLTDRLLSVFTRIDTSSEMRLAFWESTGAMILDHPFLGIGWGMYFAVYPDYDFYLQGAPVQIVHAHNMYLNYAAEIGIPGALAFLWFFFGSLVLAFRVPRRMQPWDVVLAAHAREWKTLADVREALAAWRREKFLNGLGLGLGLAFVSVALNGMTDHLLFNIPSSMFVWMLAAVTAAAHAAAGQRKEG